MASSFVVEQQVDADPDRVFAAFTSADELARWWWPHIPDTTYAIDGRAGGTYEIRSAAAGIGVRGELLDLEPPRLIRMTWTWMDEGVSGDTDEVRIGFTPDGDGTLITVTHELSPTSGDGDDLGQGWRDVLARLAKVLGAEVANGSTR